MATCGLLWATALESRLRSPSGFTWLLPDYPLRERYYKPSAYTVHLRYSTRG